MSDLIDREALLRQIDIDSEGEPGYYGDTWKFIDTIESMPPAEHGTNLAEVGTDCISREQAIDALREYLVGKRCPDDGTLTCRLIENEVINKLIPIQPKRGRWISADAIFGGVPFYCSECGENTRDTVMGKPRWNFCPNCGADMRGVTT